MRLFMAIFPDEAMRAALAETQQKLQDRGVSGSYTRRENLHLTLAFLGETEREAEARAALEAVRGFGQIPLELAGLGRFGDVWWAGVREDGRLTALAATLGKALRERDFSLEERDFAAHITLARRVRSEELPALVLPGASMKVQRVRLMRSQPADGRTVYEERFSVEL